MKTATVRDLRTDFPRLEAWLEEGETVVITKHKRIIANLVSERLPRLRFISATSSFNPRSDLSIGAII